jgi:hypothetical protein
MSLKVILFLCLSIISLIKLSEFHVTFDMFCKHRSIDLIDLGFIFFSFLHLCLFPPLKMLKNKNIIFLIYPFLSLLALIFFLGLGTDNSIFNYSKNIDTYRIIGRSCLMFLTGILIYSAIPDSKKKTEIYSTIYSLICSFAVIFLVVFILIRFFNYQPLLYGEGSPALSFPFDSPNQAAILLLILFFLALGFCVFFKKTADFIILCPIFSLAGFQTGSRAYGLLFFLFLFLLIFILFLRFLQRHKFYLQELYNILFALLLSAILFYHLMTEPLRELFHC